MRDRLRFLRAWLAWRRRRPTLERCGHVVDGICIDDLSGVWYRFYRDYAIWMANRPKLRGRNAG